MKIIKEKILIIKIKLKNLNYLIYIVLLLYLLFQYTFPIKCINKLIYLITYF